MNLSPNFTQRFNLLLEKEQDRITIGEFFEKALIEFDNYQDQRFLRWFRLGFARFSKQKLYADPMKVVLEHWLPMYIQSQNEVL